MRPRFFYFINNIQSLEACYFHCTYTIVQVYEWKTSLCVNRLLKQKYISAIAYLP